MYIWIPVGILVIVILIALREEIYHYEGVHLGHRIQGWLYNQWARKYDQDKKESQEKDAEFLGTSLLKELDNPENPSLLMLDIACGTGRLPLALYGAGFQGRVFGVDISEGMLTLANEKLSSHRDRVTLIRHPAVPLPFPPETFDIVSCLEALEIMPNMKDPLAEIARVLKPGGVLITSHGRKIWKLRGKLLEAEQFRELLRATGFEQIQLKPWWKIFDLVIARKPGRSSLGNLDLPEHLLLCPTCGKKAMQAFSPTALRCQECHTELPISPEGILLW